MRSSGIIVALAGFACGVWPVGVVLAGSQAPFSEEAVQRGISYLTTQKGVSGQGTAFVDLDGDGDADLVTLGRGDGIVGVYENDGTGFFVDHSTTCGILPVMGSSGVIAADYDNDGDLDLYISRAIGYPNMLLRNEGNFQFLDVAAAAGVDDTGRGNGGGWGDYNNDGWIDLYVANFLGTNRLYHNLGDGTFVDVAEDLGVDESNEDTFQASFFDFDRDGDADLYAANAHGQYCETMPFRNHLFENIEGTFVDITESSGTEACVDSMSIGLGDFDGNRYQDIYVTNGPWGHALLLNQGDGTFTQSEDEAGVAVDIFGWGAVFFDYDNDGYMDLYVTAAPEANLLFRHEGSWPAQNVAADLGVDLVGFSYTVATADIDGDGDLDLLVQNSGEPLRLYINQEGQTRSWVRLDVIGEGADRYAIGANVEVRTGEVWRLREVIAGSNYKNQNELVQHFGLNDATVLDEVQIMWPGGATRTLFNLPAGETWSLYPFDKLGDADGNGIVDIDDFIVFAGCFEMPLAPGCEMMDFDGNSVVDMNDFALFLAGFDGTPADCNDNGVIDMEEILLNPGLDANNDGQLDQCQCPADLSSDGTVDAADLAMLLGAWGPNPGHAADINGDDTVDAADLAMLLGAWGTCS